MQPVDSDAVGIDLGTTYSCVAIFNPDTGRVDVIPNDSDFTTPSVVAFDDEYKEDWIVGELAQEHSCINRSNTIYEVKRIIGRKFSDKCVQDDIKRWPFTVLKSPQNLPLIQIKKKNKMDYLRPEEISAKILEKMKVVAEKYLQKMVTKAVITVPAYFNDCQRKATQDAGALAGLNVLRIINEPTAAAMAYGFDSNITTDKNILIFDLGGGTFDVSLLMMDGTGIFEVKATSGNTHLGGTDFTNKLVDHCVNQFVSEHPGQTIAPGSQAMQRLRNQCERAKRLLSIEPEAFIDLDSLINDLDFSTLITRECFESLNEKLFNSCIPVVEQVLKDAKMDKSKVDEVILVGGSSRIPKIQLLLKKYFGKNLNKSINPDEAIAIGAAIQAAILMGVKDPKIKDMVLFDVTPLSLGIEIKGGLISVLLKRNTCIPIKKTNTFITTEDNQTMVTISVYEGEHPTITDNQKLDEFILGPIIALPRGKATIEVTFEIDTNGTLGVSAIDVSPGSNGVNNKVVIKNQSSRLTPQQIAELIADAERSREEDMKRKEIIENMNQFDNDVYTIGQFLKDPVLGAKFSPQEKSTLQNAIDETNLWIKTNKGVKSEELQKKKNLFVAKISPLLTAKKIKYKIS